MTWVLVAVLLLPIHADAAVRRHIVGRGTGTDSPFGVYVNTGPNTVQALRALDLAKANGIGWVQIQFTWSAIQSSASTADFRTFDQLVTAATTNKFRVLGRLGFSTPWNTTAPASVTNAAQREHYPPADYDAWSRFVFTTALRYKATVQHWEIWTQPDVGAPGEACTGSWCGTPAQYARLLSDAYKQIKSANPNAVVLFGGLAMTGAADPNFVFDVLNDPDNPGLGSFDIMGIHAYGGKSEALRIMNLIKARLAFGGAGTRPVWITEFGYPSDPAQQNVAPYFNGESGQAAYVRDLAPYLLALGARKIFWYKLIDAADDAFPSYGLVQAVSVTPKQAMTAYGEVIKSYRP